MRAATDAPVLALVMLVLIAAEFAWRRRNRGYDLRGAAASIGVAIGHAAVRPVTGAVVIAVLKLAYDWSPTPLDVRDGRTWAAGFLVVEFAYYWFHRASHQIRWLWANHSVHHSAREMILPAAIRLGWTELISLGWIIFAALALAGFPPLVIGALLGLNLLYQWPLHTEAVGRLGALEWVLNTPSHHRAHHSSDRDFLDCNFGGVTILFDRLFGTFRAEPAARGLRYGLAVPMESHNPLRIVFHEWCRLFTDIANAKGFLPRLRLALGRP